jgi:GT2 family glycosyltransferase
MARERFLASGRFRTDLSGWGGEDTDFGFRLEELGVPLRARRGARVRHPSVARVGPYLDQLRRFGSANLPALARERPRLARQFKLHLARPPLSLLLLNPHLHAVLRFLVTRLPGLPWPFAFYRYVIYNSYCRGWLESGAGKGSRH